MSLEVSQIVDEMREVIELADDGDIDVYDAYDRLRELASRLVED